MSEIPTQEEIDRLAEQAAESERALRQAQASRRRFQREQEEAKREEARKRDEAMAERAAESTDLEERALGDFTAAINEVRGKLARAFGMNPDSPWEIITPKAEDMVTTLDAAKGTAARAESERESILMALKVVRDVIVEADKVACEALGGDPHTDAEYASDLVESVRRLATTLEDEKVGHQQDNEMGDMDREKLVARIDALHEEVGVLQKGDEGQAAEWKRHVWELAALLEVPRPVMGRPESPNIDQIVRHIGQVTLPLVKLQAKVEEVEKRLDVMDPAHKALLPPEPRPKGIECPMCGCLYPSGTAFCPECGKEPDSEPVEGCETCEDMPDDCYPDPPGSGTCESYKPKAPKPVHCSCGVVYQVAGDVPPADVPGLCPSCGGKGKP